MKRIPFILILWLAATLSAMALPRKYAQALNIAKNQAEKFGTQVNEASSRRVMKKIRKADASEITQPYFVFENAEGKGFTIVSGDDLMPEILGYSLQGQLSDREMSTQFAWYLEQCAETAKAVANADPHVLRELAEARAFQQQATLTTPISPLLGETQWNQKEPFNNYCPKYNGSTLSVTGCVATAMAQIMYYHKYPEELPNDIPSYTTKTYKIPMEGEGAGYAYEWDNMLPVYGKNASDKSKHAVAMLMLHCGKAVQMDYGPSSGGWMASDALIQYFGYDPDLMQELYRGNFSISEWNTIICNELRAARPVYYRGQSSSIGHAFVCDGYDGNGLFHINWGWGGFQDGYFDLCVLNPAKGGAGSGNAADGYSRHTCAIIGIQPDNGKADAPLVDVAPITIRKSDVEPVTFNVSSRKNADESFQGHVTYRFSNLTNKDFKGYVALAVHNAEGGLEVISPEKSVSILKSTYDASYYYHQASLPFSYAFPVGVHKIIPVCRTDNSPWKVCMDNGHNVVRVKASETSISKFTDNGLFVIADNAPLVKGLACPVVLHTTNLLKDDYFGQLKAYISTSTQKPYDAHAEFTAGIESAQTKDVTIQLTPTTTGDMYLWIDDEDGTPLIQAQKYTVSEAGPKNFKLVSITTNAAPGEFQQPLYYKNFKVAIPKTHEAKAIVTYGVKNEGTLPSQGKFYVSKRGQPSAGYIYYFEQRIIPAGEIAYITVEATEEEMDSRYIMFVFDGANNDTNLDISGMPTTELPIVGATGNKKTLTFDSSTKFVYIDGDASGIETPIADRFTIMPGHGEATVIANEACHVRFTTLSGTTAAQLHLAPREKRNLKLPPGVYIVNGKKMLIK